MYLLVYVTLIIATLGIFSNVFAVQTARMLVNQTSLAQSMVEWNQSAVNAAATAIAEPAMFNAPAVPIAAPQQVGQFCNMNSGFAITAPVMGNCLLSAAYNGNAINLMQWPSNAAGQPMPACTSSQGGPIPCWSTIPPGFNQGVNFYTFAYQLQMSSGAATPPFYFDYIVTYLPMPQGSTVASSAVVPGISSQNPSLAGGGINTTVSYTSGPPRFFVATANGTPLSVTPTDLLIQLRRVGLAGNTYGVIGLDANGRTVLNFATGGNPILLPAGLPVNSIAIISQFSPCPTC